MVRQFFEEKGYVMRVRRSVVISAIALFGVMMMASASAKAEWGALAAGFQGNRVSVGSAINYDTEDEARAVALRECRSGGVSGCRVVSTFTGCGYITVSTNGSRPAAWGMGPTAQDAYDECYKRIREGNCETRTIGGCNR